MPDHAVGSDFCALRISRTVFSALSGTRLLACLIVAPQRGYDEPGILSYAISSFYPTSADGLQLTPAARSFCADVRRFGYVINEDGVLGPHSPPTKCTP